MSVGLGDVGDVPPSVPPKLALEGVWKWFGPRDVLAQIDLAVAEHEVVCIIGASDGADISVPGLDENAVRRRMGIVFQAYNLFPHRSVLANVTLGPRRALRVPREEAEQRADDLLARFGLADKRLAYPDQLSGGQQQRVAIVRALAMGPEVMLLDEITSALDPELVGEVLDVVAELKASGMTMLIATHEMGFAREIADRVCFLDAGRILEQGPPAELLGTPRHERTRRFLERVIDSRRPRPG